MLAFNKLLLVIGFVFLIHAAYSAAQRKFYFVNVLLIYLTNEYQPHTNLHFRSNIFEDNRAGINFPAIRCRFNQFYELLRQNK